MYGLVLFCLLLVKGDEALKHSALDCKAKKSLKYMKNVSFGRMRMSVCS